MPATRASVLLLGAGGWHARQLTQAFRANGVATRTVPFSRLGFATSGPGIRLGRHRALPGAVLVRTIPAGSFEQVTLRLSVLHALDALGVPVINDARAIERCVDKAMTTFLLRRHGLPVPETWTTEDPSLARAIVAQERLRGHAVVLKPLFGNQGRGLCLVREAGELPGGEEVRGVFYLQRFVGATRDWHDFRVLVVGGAAVAGMCRRGTGWVTNVRQGGRPEPVSVAGELGQLAVAAAKAIGTAYAGVDLIRDLAGNLLVLEVNSMPAWRALQSVTPVSVAAVIAAEVLRTSLLVEHAA